MTDTTAASPAPSASRIPSLTDIGNIIRRSDLGLAIGVLIILVVLILPLPPVLLDIFLAISIILSVLILMTSLFIQAPLEFSAFPTVLLVTTMLRLSLNLASTRLILSHGHEGTAAAGHVIEAFGNFVMGGLINNIWSVGGSGKEDVNFFFSQWFANYNLDDGWYLTSAPIITANWKGRSGNKWTVPVGGGVGKIFRIGKLPPMNANVQAYYNAVRPDVVGRWTLRLQFQLMFPKRSV